MNYFFSIITVNLNNAVGLTKTVSSVFNQTFKNFEYIIIDGGSTDGSVELINEYSSKINYCMSEKDNGIYDAMNKGIAKANGKYLLFLNSGDFLFNESVLQTVFNNSPAEDVLYANVMLMKKEQELRPKTYPEKLTDYFLLTDNLAHQSQFISAALFDKIGFYDVGYEIVSDYDFFIKAYYKHHISYRHLNFITTAYNLDGLSAKQESVKTINAERLRIQKKYMPAMLVFIYHTYAALLNSGVYNNKAVKSFVTFIRNLIFKFLKPQS